MKPTPAWKEDACVGASLESIECVCRDHYTPLFRFANTLLQDREEAKDICQEAFLRLHRHIEEGKKWPLNPRGWLYATTANLCRDTLRRRVIFRRLFHHPGAVGEPAPSSETEALSLESRQRVRDALDQLGIRDRLLLSLYQQDLSYIDMASMVGVKVTSVGKILARAISRLGKRLDEGEPR